MFLEIIQLERNLKNMYEHNSFGILQFKFLHATVRVEYQKFNRDNHIGNQGGQSFQFFGHLEESEKSNGRFKVNYSLWCNKLFLFY